MTGRTMTIQTQTPGGQDQPIPVKDAVEAVQGALEAMSAASQAPWYAHGIYLSSRANISASIYHLDELGQRNSPSPIQAIPFRRHEDAKAISCARAGYAGALEWLLWTLTNTVQPGAVMLSGPQYRAVAPIVQWWRQSGAQGGKE